MKVWNRISRLLFGSIILFVSCEPPSTVRIDYTPDNWALIEEDRAFFKNKWYIDSKKLHEVEAVMTDSSGIYDVETRIKGDWADHIIGDQWSQRITGQQSPFWKNMQAFSIMAPAMRDYWKEWLFHKLLHKAGVLTTQYDFEYFTVGNKQDGYWAVEEHFTQTLLENANYPSGPILRFDEDDYFDHLIRESKIGSGSELPLIQAAKIKVYQRTLWNEKDQLKEIINLAKNKLKAYQFMRSDLDTILDLQKWAQFYVVVDLCRSYHALAWHNSRYYYNPETELLEPIGFDGHAPDGGAEDWIGSPTIVPIQSDKISWSQIMNFNSRLFADTSFLNNYKKYALEYSKESWYASIFEEMAQLAEELNYPKTLRCDEAGYKKWFEEKAVNIQREAAAFKEWSAYPLNFKLEYPHYQTNDAKFYVKTMVRFQHHKIEEYVEIQNFLDVPIPCIIELGGDSIRTDTLPSFIAPGAGLLRFAGGADTRIQCLLQDTTWVLDTSKLD